VLPATDCDVRRCPSTTRRDLERSHRTSDCYVALGRPKAEPLAIPATPSRTALPESSRYSSIKLLVQCRLPPSPFIPRLVAKARAARACSRADALCDATQRRHQGSEVIAPAYQMGKPVQWLLVSPGDADDPWAWSGIPESVARALRGRGEDVVRISCDLPGPIEHSCPRLARRIPGLAASGHDAPPLVLLRNARLRGLDVEWANSRVIVFGSTFQAPIVSATFEDMTVAQNPLLPDSRARDRWQRRQAAIYGQASYCFTSTEWAAASVRSDYSQPPEKVVVAGFGPNVVCRPVPKDWSRPRFLWVGVDWTRKGGDTLLAAFRAASIPGGTLDLVGRHPEIDVPGVTGHGLIRDPCRLATMYEAATLFVLPSRFDASPIVCLEAATAGTPVLATHTGGTAEHVGAAGMTVDPQDIAALAAAMRRMSEPAVASQHRDAALTLARTRTWDQVARRMIGAFQSAPSAPSN
jgi:glycosyltransferase involved in cell wall biosynthesis